MKDLTIIIPIHKFNENIESLLKRAYESITLMKNIEDTVIDIVGPKTSIESCKNILPEKGNNIVNYIENNSNNYDVYSQINLGVKECKTKYFSVLEFDDTFKPNWLINVEKYLSFYGDISIMLPISELCNNEGNIMSYINEVAWASSFSTELGFIDIDCLQVYMDFNVTGAIIKTEDFIELGGLKSSLKIAAWYEFLMRAAHNGKKIMVIPKVGYAHTVGREDSLMNYYKNNISPEEGAWLIKTAQQEYFYKEDRNKTFKSE